MKQGSFRNTKPVFRKGAAVRIVRVLTSLFCMFLGVMAFAQTPAQPQVSVNAFSITAAPITLPGNAGSTLGGALTGVTLGVTNSFALRQTNFVSTDASVKGYFGGIDYVIPKFSTWLNNISPNLNGFDWKLEATGSVGASQISGNANSHWAFLAGGRLSYAIAGSSTYSLAVEIQDFNTPGLAHRNNLIVSVGPRITF
jgi:hypothetical protein